LAANQSKTIDVFANILNSTGAVSSTMSISGTAVNSGALISATAIGQDITVGNGTITYPSSVLNTSLSSRLVLGGSSEATYAVYNFIANNAPVVIEEMGFSVGGTSVVAGDAPVVEITVAGKTEQVSGGYATTTGLNITVPTGYAGLDVPVAVKFANVGIGGVASGNTVTTTLTYVKYRAGSTTYTTSTLAVSGYAMTLVAGKPSVTIAASTDTLVNGTVKIGTVKIAADGGPITLDNLPVSITSAGPVYVATTTNNVFVYDGGSLISTTNGSFNVLPGSTGTTTVAFTNGYRINPSDGTKSFDIYVNAAGVSGSAGTNSLTLQLGSSALFQWDDLNGNGLNITGASIYGYPSTAVSVKN
jgi:hypothetical protein